MIDENVIPILATPKQQFNYTRSWFADKGAKVAALRAFIELYPEERRYCGLISLDLAYLKLGEDYRFADDAAYFNALDDYKKVLEEYAEVPEVAAKALWYIGWISTDLLYDLNSGLAAHRRVVDEYPGERVSLLPPAPWVSIIYPQEETDESSISSRPGNSWAALALVEIIKHTEDPKVAWSTFLRLWQDYRNDVATGFGLRLVLRRKLHPEKSVAMAYDFMEKNLSNLHILSDIRKEVIILEGNKGGFGNAN